MRGDVEFGNMWLLFKVVVIYSFLLKKTRNDTKPQTVVVTSKNCSADNLQPDFKI